MTTQRFKDFLVEKRREHVKTSPETPYQVFLKLKQSGENLLDWFVSFTGKIRDEEARSKDELKKLSTREKLGINPSTTYNTPAGVFCYPLYYYEDAIDQAKSFYGVDEPFPFVGDSPYCHIFKLKPDAKMMDIYAQTVEINHKELTQGDYEKLEDKLRVYYGDDNDNRSEERERLLGRVDELQGELDQDVKFLHGLHEKINRKYSYVALEYPSEVHQAMDFVHNILKSRKTGLYSRFVDILSGQFTLSIPNFIKEKTPEILAYLINFKRQHSQEHNNTPFFEDDMVRLNKAIEILEYIYSFYDELVEQERTYKILYHPSELNRLRDDVIQFTGDDISKSTNQYVLVSMLKNRLEEYENFFGKFKTPEYTEGHHHYVGIKNNNPIAYLLWAGSRHVSRIHGKTKNRKAPFVWTEILRKVYGVDAVVDHGIGLIHPNESIQAVVLSPDKIDKGTIKYLRNTKGAPVEKTIADLRDVEDKLGKSEATFLIQLVGKYIGREQRPYTMKDFALYFPKRLRKAGTDFIISLNLLYDPHFLHTALEYVITSKDVSYAIDAIIMNGKKSLGYGTEPFYLTLWKNRKYRREYETLYGKHTPLHKIITGVLSK